MEQNIQRLKEITILYCEDEKSLRDLTSNLLTSFSKQLLVAQDGQEGLDLFIEYQNEIDLIITDVNMPHMSGLAMAEKIKEINPDIPIIVATAFSNSEYLLEAINLGIDKYVLKPIDMKKLINVMLHSLTYHELRDLYHDSLTRLLNRNALVKEIKDTPQDTLALIDIDKFSVLNDLYGENNGNQILIELANKLKIHFADQKYKIFRVGSDQFIVLSKDINESSNELKIVCEKFITNLNVQPILVNENFIDLNITIGIATGERNRAYEYAQRILGYARRSFVEIMIYNDELFNTRQDFEANIKWIKRLKDGVINKNFKAYFQPIINLKTDEIYKYESLVRYEEDDGTLIAPAVFLPIAKKAKLFPSIIRIMMEDVIKVIREKNVRVALNVSFDDINHKDTYDYIMLTLLTNTDITHLLDFEILESEEIQDFDLVAQFINEVRVYGCTIGVDDFGAGYSNFNMLEALNVDFVKIDGSLINSININKTQEIIVETIEGFAKKTGLKTVAEFISNQEIYEKTKELNIDYGQGYYFDQALPYDKVISQA